MVKKPCQSNIYEEPLTSKMGCLVFNIKAVMIKIEMNDLERCAAFCRQKDWNRLMISKYGSKRRGEKRRRIERNKLKNEKIEDEDPIKTMAPNSNDKIENTSDEAANNEHNSKMHAENGNRVDRAQKERTHLKVVQINKGHAKYNSKKNLLHAEIKSETPDIMILSEANVYPNDDTGHNELSNYNPKDKFVNSNDFARLTVMIKKGIQYERKTSFENDRCAILIKMLIVLIRTSKCKDLRKLQQLLKKYLMTTIQ